MDIINNSIVRSTSGFEEFIEEESKKTSALLKDVSLTLEQSQGELTRLTQKKANVTARLQRIPPGLEEVTKSEIRDIYIEAMDAQQRLLVMRGQLEKLQEQKNQLFSYSSLLDKTKEYIKGSPLDQDSSPVKTDGKATLEMLITAQEAERQRLSRQMHDGPAQALSNFIVQAEITAKLFDMEPAKAKDELEKLKNSAMGTFQKVRTFVSELRPMMLDDLGLVPTVKKHVAGIKEQHGLDITLTINGGEKKLESYLEVFIFRALQELVGNAIKHNQNLAGKNQIEIILSLESTQTKLVVKDNGKGFNPEQISESGGLGLKVLKERAEMLGGSLRIDSKPDSGTTVTLFIPVVELPA